MAENEFDQSYREFNREYFTNLFEQEKMLADKPRMDFYHRLIEKHIKTNQRVIDLGTGTGVLACFAEKQGASVFAIDHSHEMLQNAKLLAKSNSISNIKFFSKHSTEFNLKKPVDVILHEQIGDILFDENMVASVTDLRDRLLKPGGKILPALFDLFIEPVQIDSTRHVPMVSDMKIHGLDFSCLSSPNQDVDPDYYHYRSSDSSLITSFLSIPTPCLSFDLHTLNEEDLPSKLTFKKKIFISTPFDLDSKKEGKEEKEKEEEERSKVGRFDGLVVYFRVRDEEDQTDEHSSSPSPSSSPLSLCSGPFPSRSPHWGYRILRIKPPSLSSSTSTSSSSTCWLREGEEMEIEIEIQGQEEIKQEIQREKKREKKRREREEEEQEEEEEAEDDEESEDDDEDDDEEEEEEDEVFGGWSDLNSWRWGWRVLSPLNEKEEKGDVEEVEEGDEGDEEKEGEEKGGEEKIATKNKKEKAKIMITNSKNEVLKKVKTTLKGMKNESNPQKKKQQQKIPQTSSSITPLPIIKKEEEAVTFISIQDLQKLREEGATSKRKKQKSEKN